MGVFGLSLEKGFERLVESGRGWRGEWTHNCSYVWDHPMGGNLAVVFKKAARYGVNVV